MNVLQVIRTLDPRYGGPLAGVREISIEMERQGHRADILTLDEPGTEWSKTAGVHVHSAGPAWGSYGYALNLHHWLKKHAADYDAVVINGIWEYQSVGSWRALHGSTIPYFIYTHGMLDPWFQRHYPAKHFKKTLYWKLWEYRVLRDARAVLFTSEEERQLAPVSFRPYSCEQRVVSYGTVSPPTDRRSARLRFLETFPHLKGKRILLFLGRLHVKKGSDLLLRAFATVKDRDDQLHVVVAGPDHGHTRAELQQIVDDNNLGGRVTFTGPVFGDAKWGAFEAAELFVLSSHSENFGVSVVEALGCGLPVAISNKVNIWREIEMDGAGLICDDTVESTRQMLERWLAMTPERIARMRDNAIRSFNERYEIGHTARILVRTLKELM